MTYTITALDYLPGGTWAIATGINTSGQVCGYGDNSAGDTQGIIWNGTTATALEFWNTGDGAEAYGINDAGLVVGWTYETPGPSGGQFGVIWDDSGNLVDTSTGCNELWDINESGLACGVGVGPSGAEGATTDGVTYTALDYLSGGTNAFAYGINDSGQVTGFSADGSGDLHAVVWNGTTPTALDDFSTDPQQIGFGINASTQVAGYSDNGAGERRVISWSGTTATALDYVGSPGANDQAWGIDDSGMVVGQVGDRAGLWIGTALTLLPTLTEFPSDGAYGVNASGVIAGVVNGEADYVAVIWTPSAGDYWGVLIS